MKLKKIKLAGFKSFVDPTVLEVKSKLVGIVGPNGCGKSNIIDAVRWVMGESSAKNLRGESMDDVIFNGSTGRKPVGQASIELVFDNTEGRAAGEYAKYNEISVRREVIRNGSSNYYLNGTRCRRKDIQDLFLGTGLGPRSYSVIEQGMITRILHAKPEQVREYLEEAAGVSVYKKRRHETEIRMRHTRENLERLEDLRGEQVKTLEKLKRQSEAAKKYKVYSEEKNTLEAQLSALKWQNYDQKLKTFNSDIQERATALEERLARRATIDFELEKLRLEQAEHMDGLNEIQDRYHEIASDIARKEQSIQFQKEKKQQLTIDLEKINIELGEVGEQQGVDKEELFEYEESLAEIAPEHELAQSSYEEADILSAEAEQQMQEFNEKWEQFTSTEQQNMQTIEVEKVRVSQIEKQTKEINAQIDRLNQESNTLESTSFVKEIEQLQQQIGQYEEIGDKITTDLLEAKDNISAKRDAINTANSEIDSLKEEIQKAKGREASLEALQQAALRQDDDSLQSWLGENNLSNKSRLAQKLDIESGFELAFEAAITENLDAICVDLDNDLALENLNKAHDLKLTLLDISNFDSNYQQNSNINLDRLINKTKSDINLEPLIGNYYVADTVETAVSARRNLLNHEIIVTKDGYIVGRNWLKTKAEENKEQSVMHRKRELERLADTLAQNVETLEQKDAIILELKDSLTTLENMRDELAQKDKENQRELNNLNSSLSSFKTKLEHVESRRSRISEELAGYSEKLENISEDEIASRNILAEKIEQMSALSEQREALQAEREQIKHKLDGSKQNSTNLRDRAHELELEYQRITAKISALRENIERLDRQVEHLNSRKEELTQALTEDLEPSDDLKQELDLLLENKLEIEHELSQARNNLEGVETKIREFEKERHDIEQTTQSIRDKLDSLRLEWQGLEVRKQTIEEQLRETELSIETILENTPEEANESEWHERVTELDDKIVRLGAINEAAIEEYDAEKERNEYLEKQFEDLTNALETLEEAIAKIDEETKAKFKETFDQVNANFKILFPKLFGGGEAYLELTSEDLLESGVLIMARPPGKKNSSIHILSGGEKALTAVSLVFSIFQLNPAPLCILDEVDAPLDDANVGRYSQLIKEMSDKVQFLFISHNKLTMEIAEQLSGVTMKEPGVSRLVSVDIEEALEMAVA